MHPLATLITMTVPTISFGWFCHMHCVDFGKDENSEVVFSADIDGNHKYFVTEALLTMLTVTAGISDKFCYVC